MTHILQRRKLGLASANLAKAPGWLRVSHSHQICSDRQASAFGAEAPWFRVLALALGLRWIKLSLEQPAGTPSATGDLCTSPSPSSLSDSYQSHQLSCPPLVTGPDAPGAVWK